MNRTHVGAEGKALGDVGTLASTGDWHVAGRFQRPPKVVLGTWLFVASDALTFAALFVAYGVSRGASADWPRPFALWPSIAMAGVMTLCLAASAATMAVAVRGARAGEWHRCALALVATAGLGLAFMGLHVAEWRRLVDAGVTLAHNPWGAPLFGATFYALTGLHLLHVLGGVVALVIVASRARGRRSGSEGVAAVGIYWQFVDVVWMLLFGLVYLTSIGAGGVR